MLGFDLDHGGISRQGRENLISGCWRVKSFKLVDDVFSYCRQGFLKESTGSLGQSVIPDVVHCSATGCRGEGVYVLRTGGSQGGDGRVVLPDSRFGLLKFTGELEEGINGFTQGRVRVGVMQSDNITASINKGMHCIRRH